MRLLFITSNRIGDAIQSTGILAALLERHPAARVTVAAGPVSIPLFSHLPGLERLLPVRKRRFALHWFKLWRATVGTRWDLVVDLRASKFTWTVLTGQRLYAARKRDDEHRVIELARLIERADAPPAPRIWVSEEEETQAEALIPEGPPVLALGPTANWIGKTWPAERFAELARRLTAPGGLLPGARLAVFGAPGERNQALPLLDAVPPERIIDLIGRLELPLAAACLRRCPLFVGNDSGLMHLAAAAGVPTLGLFGPSSEVRYRPWGSHCDYVRTPESMEEIINRPGYHHTLPVSWMTGLEVEPVAAAARRLYDRSFPTTAVTSATGNAVRE